MAISTLTTDSLGEYLTARSVYHLKEGDPHSFAIPRLTGRAKSALVEIQADEYGDGSAERMHSALFAGMMRDLGLDAGDGAVGRRPGGRLFVGEHHVAVRPAPPLAVPALPLAR